MTDLPNDTHTRTHTFMDTQGDTNGGEAALSREGPDSAGLQL